MSVDAVISGRTGNITVRRRVVEGYPQAPRVTVTDKLVSDGPAIKKVLPRTDHRRRKEPHNRAENSHQPMRQRERAMRGQRLLFAIRWRCVCPVLHTRPRVVPLAAQDGVRGRRTLDL